MIGFGKNGCKPVRGRFLCLGYLVLAGLTLTGCGKKEKSKPPKTAQVARVDLVDYMGLSGILEAREQVNLKSEVGGQIARIYVQEGDMLKVGDTILWVDPLQLRNRQKQQVLSLKRTDIQFRQAKRNYENGEKLLQVEGVSRQRLEDLKWQMDLAKIQYEENKLSLEESNILLARCAVLAPIEGSMVSLPVKKGEVIVAGTASVGGGTTLGIIADLARMTVTVNVSEVDYANLRLGQAVKVSTEAKPEEKYPGKVEYISKMAKEVKDKNVRNFEVRVSVDSLSDSWVPGLNVLVEFQVLDLKNVLALPFEMVYRNKGKGESYSYVWRLGGSKESKPEKIRVKTGKTDYTHMEIRSGVKEGDRVREEDAPAGTEKAPSGGRARRVH